MAGIGDIVDLNGIKTGELTSQILDFVYGKNCILLNDIRLIFNNPINIPCPIIGFEYEIPDHIELLSFSYSDYPFLDRTSLINAYFKNNTKISLKAYRPITPLNPFTINLATNELIYAVLDKYCLNGGTFTILTSWGAYSNVLLEKLSGIKTGSNDIGGQGFQFDFIKVNIQTKEIQAIQSSYLASIDGGGVL